MSNTATSLPQSVGKLTTQRLVMIIFMAALAILPVASFLFGNEFYITIATRLVILCIAAVSLNLILGYGGMVSFGHAAFLGIGAYAVGIPTYHATFGEWDAIASYNGFFHLALMVIFSGLFALITGAISLRTRGVHFIMITMAFGQMLFFLLLSLDTYGGDDGLTIDVRSEFPLIDLNNPLTLYIVCYLSLIIVMFIIYRLVNSRFGAVLRGGRENEERLRSLGYSPYFYKLTAYVISGIICGYAGFLLGNFTSFISPEMADWSRSGELMFMVILGGVATIIGPIFGASAFLLLEEILQHAMHAIERFLETLTGAQIPDLAIYWHLPFGILLILAVLFLKGGLSGLVRRISGERD